MAGYVLGVVLTVGSAAILFRHLGVADGGRYVTVLSLVALFGGLTEAGLATIAVRELAAGASADRNAYLRQLLGLRIALTLTAAACAVGFAAVAGYDEVLVAGTALAAVGLLLQSLQLTLGSSLMARLEFGWVTALDLLKQVATVALIVLLVLLDAELLAFLALSIPAGLIALAPTAMLVRGDFPMMPAFDRQAWIDLLRDVLPYAAATAITAVYFRVALILVSLINSEEQTGYFAASFRIVEVAVGVPVLAVGAAFPVFARAARDDRARLAYGVQRVFDVSAVLGGLVVVCLVVGAPLVIDIVAGSEFEPAAEVLRIQSVGLFASFIAAVWGYALLSMHRHRALLYLTLTTLLVNVVLTLVLASIAEARGAAVATAAGEAVLAVAGGIVLARALGAGALSTGTLVRVLLAGGAAAALALVTALPVVVLVACAVAVYLVVLWAIGGLPSDLIRDLLASRGSPPAEDPA